MEERGNANKEMKCTVVDIYWQEVKTFGSIKMFLDIAANFQFEIWELSPCRNELVEKLFKLDSRQTLISLGQILCLFTRKGFDKKFYECGWGRKQDFHKE